MHGLQDRGISRPVEDLGLPEEDDGGQTLRAGRCCSRRLVRGRRASTRTRSRTDRTARRFTGNGPARKHHRSPRTMGERRAVGRYL